MNQFFSLDSPVMQFLNRAADIIILNVLTVLLCLPVVTAGAALTAMHYVLLQMVRGEENYVAKTFFRTFASNFRKATLLWLILLAAGIVLGMDIYIGIKTGLIPAPLRAVIYFLTLIVLLTFQWVFPLTAKFENSIPATLRNALLFAVAKFPITLAMLLMQVTIVVLMLYNTGLIMFTLFIGAAGPGYLAARMYSPVFKELEKKLTGGGEQEENTDAVFRDSEKEGPDIPPAASGITPIPVERKHYGNEEEQNTAGKTEDAT